MMLISVSWNSPGYPRGGSTCSAGPTTPASSTFPLLPEQRGRGVGTALLTAVFAESVPAGRSVSIHVELFNPARRLYERLGFRELSRNGVYALMEWPGTKATATAVAPDR